MLVALTDPSGPSSIPHGRLPGVICKTAAIFGREARSPEGLEVSHSVKTARIKGS